MPTDRRFAAFSRDAVAPRMDSIPEGGLCISAFLVISKTGNPNEVIMGRINANAPWDHIGALDGKRLARVGSGWMLPSSHLMLFETPEGAARRVLREQLGIRGQRLVGPLSFADTSGSANHWDIGFVFSGERDSVHRNDAWDELRFVDVTGLKPDDVVRSHTDVLAYAGRLRPKTASTRLTSRGSD